MRAVGASWKAALAAATLCAASLPANAIDFAVPVEAAGINAAVKSLRIACVVAAGPEGLTAATGVQFVAVTAGAVNQTVTVKLDVPLGKAKPGSAYQCYADRAFEVDVTKLNPVPSKYTKLPGHISEGMSIKDINLQANSVVMVGGKI
jgi:hypothetical protein